MCVLGGKTLFISGGKLFQTKAEAIAYANFIAKVSRIIVSVEEVK